MNIGRIKTIRIIFGPAVSEKKALLPKLVASIQCGLKFVARSFATVDNARQTGKNKRRMEVVAPRLIIASAIDPRTVLALTANYIARIAMSQRLSSSVSLPTDARTSPASRLALKTCVRSSGE